MYILCAELFKKGLKGDDNLRVRRGERYHQILDAVRLRDTFMEKEIPFTDAIIIITTNAGRQLYEND